jgi:hypothetical protein
MTAQHHQASVDEEVLIDTIQALRLLDEDDPDELLLGERFCLAEPIGYAQELGLPQEIIDRLEKVDAAARVLVYEGWNAIWDFVKAANLTDEVVEREPQWRRKSLYESPTDRRDESERTQPA